MRHLSLIKFLFVVITLIPLASHAVDGVSVTSYYPDRKAITSFYGEILNTDIYRVTIQSSQVVSRTLLVSGAQREHLSPNGQKVAFTKNGKVCVMSINGGAVTELCNCDYRLTGHLTVSAGPGLDFPHDDWIYFTGAVVETDSAGVIYRVNVNTKAVEHVVTLRPEGNVSLIARLGGSDMDISNTLDRICAHIPGNQAADPMGGYTIYNMSAGDGILRISNTVSGNSCGGGMSCDGVWLYDGYWDHKHYSIRPCADITKLEVYLTVREHSPSGSGGSTNSPDWICRTVGDGWTDSLRQCLYNWRTGEEVITGKGDGGDFWVGSMSTTPVMQLTPGTLVYSADKGAGSPAAQNIALTNSGSGTLNAATTTIAYGAGQPTGWLAVSVAGGVTNSQTLANTVTVGTKDTGAYTATVTVSCQNATPTTATYTVSFYVSDPALSLSSIVVSPAICTTFTWANQQLSAVAMSPGGVLNPQPAISWSVSGSQTISATTGMFSAPQIAGGPYTVTATATRGGITKSGTGTVLVLRPITITAPAVGVVRRYGDTLTITWTRSAITPTKGVQVYFSTDGRTWTVISDGDPIADNDAQFYNGLTATFTWIVPETFTLEDGSIVSSASTTGRIRVKDEYAAITTQDISPAFTVQDPNATAGIFAIPGTIEAENFTNGYDTTGLSLNTEACLDIGGGLAVAFINNNSWIEYPVKVVTAGTYTLTYRTATTKPGSTIELRCGTGSIASTTPLCITSLDTTGGYQTWKSASSTVTLAAGIQTLRLTFKGQDGVCNINNMIFTGTPSSIIKRPMATSSFGVHGKMSVFTVSGKSVGTFTASQYTTLTKGLLKPGAYVVRGTAGGKTVSRTIVIP